MELDAGEVLAETQRIAPRVYDLAVARVHNRHLQAQVADLQAALAAAAAQSDAAGLAAGDAPDQEGTPHEP